MQLALQPRFRALDAVSAVRGILRDPSDTAQVFRLIDALSGPTPRHLVGRFSASRTGARLLAERPRVLERLRDHAELAALPAGSLGRAYLDFMTAGGLTPDGLLKASEVLGPEHEREDEAAWIGQRMRDTHDLWHVVTGYRGDLLGEGSLLAFSWAQTRTRGIGVLAAIAIMRADDPDDRRLLLDGLVRGLRAAWLPAVPWEELLAEDLEVVRARLRVGPPPAYVPLWAHELPAGGLFQRAAA
jgi:ubiquinone biosynthesis protein COQ4